MKKIDPELQSQIDAQLMEQGAFSSLDLLLNTGRIFYSEYEAWRRGEIASLDEALMGDPAKIRAQLDDAVGYARSIGLAEQIQEFFSWRDRAQRSDDKPLRISGNAQLQRLIASRFAPKQNEPQLDLFFDNPIVALTNGIARALSLRDAIDAQRQLDRLYAQAPTHADLPGFDLLLKALLSLQERIDDTRTNLEFLHSVSLTAKRLLGAHSKDLLNPLWRHLADALHAQPFTPEEPNLHRSHALQQAQDWQGVSAAVREEPDWQQHAALCMRLAQSAFYRRDRIEALTAWFHLCWRHPSQAERALESRQQLDSSMAAAWRRLIDEEARMNDPDDELTAAEFPAWLLLHEPGLAQQLPETLPGNDETTGAQLYRCVHRWAQARRTQDDQQELALRRMLQGMHAGLFRRLKQRVAG